MRNKGRIRFGTVALPLALVSCAGHQDLVSIKPIGNAAVAQPQGADELIALGRRHLSDGQFGLAIGQFREALRFEPDSAAASNGLGIAYARIGRADLASRYFERAMAFAPQDLAYRRNYERFLADNNGAQPEALAAAQAEPAPVAHATEVARGYRLKAEIVEVDVAALSTAPTGPSLSQTATGMSLTTTHTPAKAAQAPVRQVTTSFTLERSAAPAGNAPAPTLSRVSLREVRITSQRPQDALATIMQRDFRAQWAAETAGRTAPAADRPTDEAFHTAIGNARQRLAASRQIATAQRACARARLFASYGMRGSEQCSS